MKEKIYVDNGVMDFDRSGYDKAARTEGQMTLDGTVWNGMGHVTVDEYRGA